MKYEFHWFDSEEYPVKVIDIVEVGAGKDNNADKSTGKEYIFPCTCNLLTIVKLQIHICISDVERDGEGELTSDAELTEYETDNESDKDSE